MKGQSAAKKARDPESATRARLIIVSAPSGAGKTTLCERLIAELSDTVVPSVSTTTRPPRPHEKDGVHYHFVTPEAFQKKIDRGEFAEWAEVHGHRYGTSKKVIEANLTQGKNVLFSIDVQGAMNLKKHYSDRALLIFIHPPSLDELEARLRKRGDSPQSIETRLRNAYNELAWSRRFDHQITNDNLEKAYKDFRNIIKKECP